MKRIIFTQILFFLFISFTSLYAQWAKTYGGNENDVVWSLIQQTSDGGYIVTGYTESFGAGRRDIWILKLDSNGTIEWQRTYGGSYNELANSIQQTSDGGYIAAGISFSFGSGSGDFWVLKLDSTGNIEWQRAYGGSEKDYATSIQQTNDGGYIVEGQTYSFGSGWIDIWILKLSSVGDIEWQRTYGGSSGDFAWWIQQTSDGGYIIAGETYSFGDGSDDAWILKLSSVGDIEWQRIYGGNKQDWSSIIQQTSDGGYIVAGGGYSFGAGNQDGWILKLSSVGDIEWQRTYGGIGNDYTWHIQQTNDGGYIIAGDTFSFSEGEGDAWIFKVDTIGNIEWQRTYGGGDYDYARSIQQTSDGGYIVTGSTESFGAGGRDIWALKLDSTGEISPSCGFMGSPNAIMTYPDVYPEDTYITPQETTVTPFDTNVFPQDTEATVTLLCSIFTSPDEEDESGSWELNCFIATAAYDSPFHSHVEILRNFRDNYLITNKLGRKLVKLYYRYSPSLANIIAKHKILKIAVRISLLPLVVFSYSIVYFGPIKTFTLGFLYIFSFFLLWHIVKRRKRRGKLK